MSGNYRNVTTTFFVVYQRLSAHLLLWQTKVMWFNFENANVSLRSGIFGASGQNRTQRYSTIQKSDTKVIPVSPKVIPRLHFK